jgi:hypothetical protein
MARPYLRRLCVGYGYGTTTRERRRKIMSNLINELIELAEELVELTTIQPTINDLKRMEEEANYEG